MTPSTLLTHLRLTTLKLELWVFSRNHPTIWGPPPATQVYKRTHTRGRVRLGYLIAPCLFFALFTGAGFTQPVQTEQANGAQSPKTLDQMETDRKIREIENMLDSADFAVDKFVNSRIADVNYQCMRAFPDPRYCSCIANNLFTSLDFREYVGILLIEKDKITQQELDDETSSQIDHIYELREKCALTSGSATGGLKKGSD